MTWSYDETALATPLNFVRYKIGDTTQDSYSPSNELITYWLTTFAGDKYKAAAEIARNQARKFAKLALTSSEGTVKIGGMSLAGAAMSYETAKDYYTDLAKELDGRSGEYTGGIASPAYTETYSQFSIGMMDNPR